MRRWCWLLALAACDDGADATDAASAPLDMRPADARIADAAVDGGEHDGATADAAPLDQAVDAGPADAGPGDAGADGALADATPADATPPPADCLDTVQVAGFEIFRYEASRPDATADAQGADAAQACSRAGVLPWTNLTLADAEAACAASGFSVCSGDQWQEACVGPELWPYPYGEAYVQGICNDHVTGSGALEVTGGRADCVGPSGIHDQNGNVWEMTADGRRRGASYRLNASMFRPEAGACESSYVVPDAFFARDLGFRCCRALPPPG